MRIKELRNLGYAKTYPAKQTAQTPSSDKGEEHEKLVASIASIREGIESAEKKYKNLINYRKRHEVTEAVKGLPTLEPITSEDLVTAARELLIETKTRTKTIKDDKSNLERDLNEKLKILNENTREWYKKRRELTAAGPKFKRHSFSPFGRVLLVTPISQNIFTIITSKNTVEVWEVDVEGPDQKSRMIEVFEIPGNTNFSCAIDLFQHECVDDNMDLLKNIPDHEKYITGIRNTVWVKRKIPPKPKVVPVKPKEEEEEPEGSEDEKEEDDDGIMRIPDQFLRRNSFLRVYDDLDALASTKLPSWKDTKELVDWSTYPLADAPKIYFKNMYFCGCANGTGMLIEVLSAYNPLTRKTTTACQVRHHKPLSQSAIKLAFFKSLQDGTPIISVEITTKSAEHFVVGLRLDLEIEWSLRCDVIRMTMTDKCTRYISKDQQMVIFDDKKESRAPEENLITCISYDDIYASLLLGTVGGSVLRLFYQKEKKGVSKRNISAEEGDEEGLSKSGAPLKLVWCLELTGQVVKHKSIDNLNNSHHDLPGPPIKITSVKHYLDKTDNLTNLLVGASDGIVRVFVNDNLKVTPNPSLFYLDRFFRNDAKANKEGKSFESGFESEPIHCDCEYVGTEDGVNLVVGVTSKNSLIIYDPLDTDNIFLERQILSNIIANGKHAEGEKGCFIKILDPKRGMVVVYHGKYWSIVSIADMMNFRRKKLSVAIAAEPAVEGESSEAVPRSSRPSNNSEAPAEDE